MAFVGTELSIDPANYRRLRITEVDSIFWFIIRWYVAIRIVSVSPKSCKKCSYLRVMLPADVFNVKMVYKIGATLSSTNVNALLL